MRDAPFFEYRVVKGDTLSGLAARFKTDIKTLQALNPEIKDPNLIRIGQVLKIPQEPKLPPKEPKLPPEPKEPKLPPEPKVSIPTPPEAPKAPKIPEVLKVPEVPVESPIEYKVVRDDTLSAIAARFKTDIPKILALNPEIKDPNLIREGQIIKLPPLPKAPEAPTLIPKVEPRVEPRIAPEIKPIEPEPERKPLKYEEVFDLFKERLYRGEFGREGAREKMGQELLSRFPNVDVWKDIYSKIPDHWEKEAFKFLKYEKEIKKESLPIWERVGLKVGQTIKTKSQDLIIKPLSGLFARLTPSEEEAIKITDDFQNLLKINQGVRATTPAVVYGPTVFEKLVKKPLDYIKESFSAVLKWHETEVGKWVWKKIPPFSSTQYGFELRERERQEKEINENIRVLTKIQDVIKGVKPADFDEMSKDLNYAAAMVVEAGRQLEKALEEIGAVPVESPEGIQFKIPAVEKQFSQQTDKIYKLIDSKWKENIDNQGKLLERAINLILPEALDFTSFLLRPENYYKYSAERQKWVSKLEGADQLLNLDISLKSLNEILDEHKRSVTDTTEFYKAKVPKWQEELKSLVSKRSWTIISKEQPTEAEQNEFLSEVTAMRPEQARRVIELTRQLNDASRFSNLVGGIWDLVSDEKFWPVFQDFFREKADTKPELAKVFADLITGKKALETGVFGLTEDLVKRSMEANSLDTVENALKEIKTSPIPNDVKDAFIEMLTLNKKFIQNSDRLVKAVNFLAQSDKAYRKAQLFSELEFEEERSKMSRKLVEYWGTPTVLKPKYLFSKDGRRIMAQGTVMALEDLFSRGPFGAALKGLEAYYLFVVQQCLPRAMAFVNLLRHSFTPLEGDINEFEVMREVMKKEAAKLDKETRKLWTMVDELARVPDPTDFSSVEAKLNRELDKAIKGEVPKETVDLAVKKGPELIQWFRNIFLAPDKVPNEIIQTVPEIPETLREGRWKGVDPTNQRIINRWQFLVDYYKNPLQFEHVKLHRPMKVEWEDGQLRLGNIVYPQIKSIADLLDYNPTLKDLKEIPAGTTLLLPRFHSVPRFSDFLSPDDNFNLYQNSPIASKVIDFVSEAFVDPFVLFWPAMRTAMGTGLKEAYSAFRKLVIKEKRFKVPELPEPSLLSPPAELLPPTEPLKKPTPIELPIEPKPTDPTDVLTVDSGAAYYLLVLENIYKFLSGRTYNPLLFPVTISKLVLKGVKVGTYQLVRPLREIRARILGMSLLRGLSDIPAAAKVWQHSENMKYALNTDWIALEVETSLRKHLTDVNDPDRIIQNIVRSFLGDEEPLDATIKILNDIGIHTFDLYKIADLAKDAESRKFIKDKIHAFMEVVLSKKRQDLKVMLDFSKHYLEAPQIAKDYFKTLWFEASEPGGYLTPEVWKRNFKKFENALFSFRKTYYENIKSRFPDLKITSDELKRGEDLFFIHQSYFGVDWNTIDQLSHTITIAPNVVIRELSKDEIKKWNVIKKGLLFDESDPFILRRTKIGTYEFYYVKEHLKLRHFQIPVRLDQELISLRLTAFKNQPYGKMTNYVRKVTWEDKVDKWGRVKRVRKVEIEEKQEYNASLTYYDALMTSFFNEMKPKMDEFDSKLLKKLYAIIEERRDLLPKEFTDEALNPYWRQRLILEALAPIEHRLEIGDYRSILVPYFQVLTKMDSKKLNLIEALQQAIALAYWNPQKGIFDFRYLLPKTMRLLLFKDALSPDDLESMYRMLKSYLRIAGKTVTRKVLAKVKARITPTLRPMTFIKRQMTMLDQNAVTKDIISIQKLYNLGESSTLIDATVGSIVPKRFPYAPVQRREYTVGREVVEQELEELKKKRYEEAKKYYENWEQALKNWEKDHSMENKKILVKHIDEWNAKGLPIYRKNYGTVAFFTSKSQNEKFLKLKARIERAKKYPRDSYLAQRADYVYRKYLTTFQSRIFEWYRRGYSILINPKTPLDLELTRWMADNDIKFIILPKFIEKGPAPFPVKYKFEFWKKKWKRWFRPDEKQEYRVPHAEVPTSEEVLRIIKNNPAILDMADPDGWFTPSAIQEFILLGIGFIDRPGALVEPEFFERLLRIEYIKNKEFFKQFKVPKTVLEWKKIVKDGKENFIWQEVALTPYEILRGMKTILMSGRERVKHIYSVYQKRGEQLIEVLKSHIPLLKKLNKIDNIEDAIDADLRLLDKIPQDKRKGILPLNDLKNKISKLWHVVRKDIELQPIYKVEEIIENHKKLSALFSKFKERLISLQYRNLKALRDHSLDELFFKDLPALEESLKKYPNLLEALKEAKKHYSRGNINRFKNAFSKATKAIPDDLAVEILEKGKDSPLHKFLGRLIQEVKEFPDNAYILRGELDNISSVLRSTEIELATKASVILRNSINRVGGLKAIKHIAIRQQLENLIHKVDLNSLEELRNGIKEIFKLMPRAFFEKDPVLKTLAEGLEKAQKARGFGLYLVQKKGGKIEKFLRPFSNENFVEISNSYLKKTHSLFEDYIFRLRKLLELEQFIVDNSGFISGVIKNIVDTTYSFYDSLPAVRVINALKQKESILLKKIQTDREFFNEHGLLKVMWAAQETSLNTKRFLEVLLNPAHLTPQGRIYFLNLFDWPIKADYESLYKWLVNCQDFEFQKFIKKKTNSRFVRFYRDTARELTNEIRTGEGFDFKWDEAGNIREVSWGIPYPDDRDVTMAMLEMSRGLYSGALPVRVFIDAKKYKFPNTTNFLDQLLDFYGLNTIRDETEFLEWKKELEGLNNSLKLLDDSKLEIRGIWGQLKSIADEISIINNSQDLVPPILPVKYKPETEEYLTRTFNLGELKNKFREVIDKRHAAAKELLEAVREDRAKWNRLSERLKKLTPKEKKAKIEEFNKLKEARIKKLTSSLQEAKLEYVKLFEELKGKVRTKRKELEFLIQKGPKTVELGQEFGVVRYYEMLLEKAKLRFIKYENSIKLLDKADDLLAKKAKLEKAYDELDELIQRSYSKLQRHRVSYGLTGDPIGKFDQLPYPYHTRLDSPDPVRKRLLRVANLMFREEPEITKKLLVQLDEIDLEIKHLENVIKKTRDQKSQIEARFARLAKEKKRPLTKEDKLIKIEEVIYEEDAMPAPIVERINELELSNLGVSILGEGEGAAVVLKAPPGTRPALPRKLTETIPYDEYVKSLDDLTTRAKAQLEGFRKLREILGPLFVSAHFGINLTIEDLWKFKLTKKISPELKAKLRKAEKKYDKLILKGKKIELEKLEKSKKYGKVFKELSLSAEPERVEELTLKEFIEKYPLGKAGAPNAPTPTILNYNFSLTISDEEISTVLSEIKEKGVSDILDLTGILSCDTAKDIVNQFGIRVHEISDFSEYVLGHLTPRGRVPWKERKAFWDLKTLYLKSDFRLAIIDGGESQRGQAITSIFRSRYLTDLEFSYEKLYQDIDEDLKRVFKAVSFKGPNFLFPRVKAFKDLEFFDPRELIKILRESLDPFKALAVSRYRVNYYEAAHEIENALKKLAKAGKLSYISYGYVDGPQRVLVIAQDFRAMRISLERVLLSLNKEKDLTLLFPENPTIGETVIKNFVKKKCPNVKIETVNLEELERLPFTKEHKPFFTYAIGEMPTPDRQNILSRAQKEFTIWEPPAFRVQKLIKDVKTTLNDWRFDARNLPPEFLFIMANHYMFKGKFLPKRFAVRLITDWVLYIRRLTHKIEWKKFQDDIINDILKNLEKDFRKAFGKDYQADLKERIGKALDGFAKVFREEYQGRGVGDELNRAWDKCYDLFRKELGDEGARKVLREAFGRFSEAFTKGLQVKVQEANTRILSAIQSFSKTLLKERPEKDELRLAFNTFLQVLEKIQQEKGDIRRLKPFFKEFSKKFNTRLQEEGAFDELVASFDDFLKSLTDGLEYKRDFLKKKTDIIDNSLVPSFKAFSEKFQKRYRKKDELGQVFDELFQLSKETFQQKKDIQKLRPVLRKFLELSKNKYQELYQEKAAVKKLYEAFEELYELLQEGFKLRKDILQVDASIFTNKLAPALKVFSERFKKEYRKRDELRLAFLKFFQASEKLYRKKDIRGFGLFFEKFSNIFEKKYQEGAVSKKLYEAFQDFSETVRKNLSFRGEAVNTYVVDARINPAFKAFFKRFQERYQKKDDLRKAFNKLFQNLNKLRREKIDIQKAAPSLEEFSRTIEKKLQEVKQRKVTFEDLTDSFERLFKSLETELLERNNELKKYVDILNLKLSPALKTFPKEFKKVYLGKLEKLEKNELIKDIELFSRELEEMLQKKGDPRILRPLYEKINKTINKLRLGAKTVEEREFYYYKVAPQFAKIGRPYNDACITLDNIDKQTAQNFRDYIVTSFESLSEKFNALYGKKHKVRQVFNEFFQVLEEAIQKKKVPQNLKPFFEKYSRILKGDLLVYSKEVETVSELKKAFEGLFKTFKTELRYREELLEKNIDFIDAKLTSSFETFSESFIKEYPKKDELRLTLDNLLQGIREKKNVRQLRSSLEDFFKKFEKRYKAVYQEEESIRELNEDFKGFLTAFVKGRKEIDAFVKIEGVKGVEDVFGVNSHIINTKLAPAFEAFSKKFKKQYRRKDELGQAFEDFFQASEKAIREKKDIDEIVPIKDKFAKEFQKKQQEFSKERVVTEELRESFESFSNTLKGGLQDVDDGSELEELFKNLLAKAFKDVFEDEVEMSRFEVALRTFLKKFEGLYKRDFVSEDLFKELQDFLRLMRIELKGEGSMERLGDGLQKFLAAFKEMQKRGVISEKLNIEFVKFIKIFEILTEGKGRWSTYKTALKDFLGEQKEEIKALFDELRDYVFEFDKNQTLLEKIRQTLWEKIGITESELGYRLLKGMPIDDLDLTVNQRFINGLWRALQKGALWALTTIPYFGKRVFPGAFLRRLTTFWTMAVLYYRAAWYKNNAVGDGFRMVYATRDITFFSRAVAQLLVSASSFLRKIGGDLTGIPRDFLLTYFRIDGDTVREVEKLAGRGWGQWLRKQVEKAKTTPEIWDPVEAARLLKEGKKVTLPGMWDKLNARLWKASGASEILNFHLAVEKTRRGLLTPRGEKLGFETLQYLSAGLLGSQNRNFMKLVQSWLPETTLLERFKKRLYMTHLNVLYWAGVQESLRREMLIFDLLFRKAMTLAETKRQVWKYLFNYSDLTAVGQFFRKFFPFYAYTSKFIKLFLQECWRHGPRMYYAAHAFIQAWSQSTESLPLWMRMKIPVGGGYYWGSPSNLLEIFYFAANPKEALTESILNPQRLPFGFAWGPMWRAAFEIGTGMKYWDTGLEMELKTGLTKRQTDAWHQKYGIKRDLSDPKFWYDLLLTFCPPLEVIRALIEFDMSTLFDGRSVLKNKQLRIIMRWFGFNVMKWEDVDQFRYILFELPPGLRSEFLKRMKEENPFIVKALENEWARARWAKLMNAKEKDFDMAMREFQKQGVVSTYFELEEHAKGAGARWLIRAPGAKKLMDEFWAERELTPWNLYQRVKYHQGVIRSRAIAILDLVKERKIKMAAEILNIPFEGIVGEFDDIQKLFFDEKGGLRVFNETELETLLGPLHENYFSYRNKPLRELIVETATRNYHEWLYESVRGRPEDREFAKKMAKLKAIIPHNLRDLPEESQKKVWELYNYYFKTKFTDEEKLKYYSGFEPWYREYRKKMEEYISLWEKLIKTIGEEDARFFAEFYKMPEWARELYFLKYPNKKHWYPHIYKWSLMIEEIEIKERETFVYQKELRKKASEFLFSREDLLRLWDKDKPGTYAYFKDWQKIIELTEDNPFQYFEEFYKMPASFQERFFKKNPEKKIYYPFLREWLNKIKQDEKNWKEKGIRTQEASKYFWAPENKSKRDAYAKIKKVAPGKSIIDYLKIWDNIMREVSEEQPEDYFDLFFKQENWFKEHFFRVHPEKKIYYPKLAVWVKLIKQDKEILDKTGKSPGKAREYYLKEIRGNREVAEAWNKANPGVIEYQDTWIKIMEETEKNPEKYFDLFYSQSESFRERFFRNNRSKELYYPVLRKWIEALAIDKKNYEKGIRTHLARDYFRTWKDTEAGRAYAKDNPIDGHNVIEYLELWDDIITRAEEDKGAYFTHFYSKPEWFINHFFKTKPEQKIYYPFARKLFSLPPEERSRFFWAPQNEEARQAWERAKPGFLDYMRFWKKLSVFSEAGQWDLYYETYWAPENRIFRERHWKSDPESKEKFTLMWQYSKMPSLTWEEKKRKREFLKEHPQLIKWWSENLSAEEAAMRRKVEEYYNLLDAIPETGTGRDYILDYVKAKVTAERYLKDNPDVLLYMQKNAKVYLGNQPEIIRKVREYFALDLPSQRADYIKNNPELKIYFKNLLPPGMRTIQDLQDRYFQLGTAEREAFLTQNPILKEYWELERLPWSYFYAPDQFRPYQIAASKVEKYYEASIKRDWAEAEALRKALPEIFFKPGNSDEDEWFKAKIYFRSMEAWISISKSNELMGIYFFRQLPQWIRDRYLQRRSPQRYLTTEPLDRFVEEPINIEDAIYPDLAWAQRIHAKYGKNIPFIWKEKVRDIFIKYKIWEDRKNWTRQQWMEYYWRRTLLLNECNERDLAALPLLRSMFNKVARSLPLKRKRPFSKPRLGVIQPFL